MQYMYNTFSKRAVGIKKHTYLCKHDELEKKPGRALAEHATTGVEKPKEQREKVIKIGVPAGMDIKQNLPGLTSEEQQEVLRRVEDDETRRTKQRIVQVGTWDEEEFKKKIAQKNREALKPTEKDPQREAERNAAEVRFGRLENMSPKQIRELLQKQYPGFEVNYEGHVTKQPILPWKKRAFNEPIFQALIRELQERFLALPKPEIQDARLPQQPVAETKGFFSRLLGRG